MSNQNHHYFASCVFGWATADTRDEAIRKCVNQFRGEYKNIVANSHKKGDLGGYVWSCRVMADSKAKYEINFYQPQGVPIEEGCNHWITYITGEAMAYYSDNRSERDRSEPDDSIDNQMELIDA